MDDLVNAVKLIAKCERAFEARGIKLEVSSDFRRFREICESSPRGFVSRLFDPDYVDLLPHNGFWVIGWKDNDPYFSVAMRLDDLGTMDLNTYWRLHLSRLFPEGEADTLDADVDSQMHKISGKVAYHGEMWIDSRGRGQGIAPLACLHSIAWGVVAFKPDWVIAIVGGGALSVGLSFREGYGNADPLIEEWRWAPGYIAKDEFLIWLDRRELEIMLRVRANSAIGESGQNADNIANNPNVDAPRRAKVLDRY